MPPPWNGRRAICLVLPMIALACAHQDGPAEGGPAPRPTSLRNAPLPVSTPLAPASPAPDVAGAAQRFVEQGLRGERLKETPCIRRDAITCGSAMVVSSFSLDSAIISGDTARVAVRYEEVGSVHRRDAALRYLSRDSLARTRADTLVLARNAGDASGWRVIRADPMPRLSGKLAMYYFDLSEQDAERLAVDAGLDFARAARSVLTPPSTLTQLPRDVRDTLTVRGCKILQNRGDSTTNVVHGAFFGTGDGDWAVLCVARAKDVILVFPHGGGAPAALENVAGGTPDVDALPNPDASGAVNGCAPSIFLVTASFLRPQIAEGSILAEASVDTLSASERKTPAHDGLGNGDCEGVSNIHYWTGRRWVRLAGGD